MDKFNEIIQFRHTDQRNDFLEYLLEKGLNAKERSEIAPIIQACFTRYNDWTLVLLIDITSKEQIVSQELFSIYKEGLFGTKTYYVKLSILDYITETKSLYREANINTDFSFLEELAYNKRNKLIIRNQALLILIRLYPSKKENLLLELRLNLKKSIDYRVHIRLYNSLLNDFSCNEIAQEKIIDFIKISKNKNFDKSVLSIIKELESNFSL